MKKYWKSIEEINELEVVQEAVQEEQNQTSSLIQMLEHKDRVKASRRDFLKLFGYTAGIAATASCTQPVRKAIPYLVKPENITPGKASYFASTFFQDNEYCSILVKVRDGRPIKIEGNDLSTISKNGTSARVQGAVLSLYDSDRFQSPMIGAEKSTWNKVDAEIANQLNSFKEQDKKVVLLTSTIISPSTLKLIGELTDIYPNIEHVTFDDISKSAMIEANQSLFGVDAIANYHFDKSNYNVSLSADFLGTWIDPTRFSSDFASTRRLSEHVKNKTMSKLVVFESRMSLTGSNADERITLKPSQELATVKAIYAGITGGSASSAPVEVKEVVKGLLANKGKSIIVSGSNDVNVQTVVAAINQALGNYGNTLDLENPLLTYTGKDNAFISAMDGLKSKDISGVILYKVNPAYMNSAWGDAIAKAELSISLDGNPNETTAKVKYVCPDSHLLESWNDAEPVKNHYSLAQPAIQTIFDTRQIQDTLLKWIGNKVSYYDYLKSNWESTLFGRSGTASFKNFWNETLQKGILDFASTETSSLSVNEEALSAALSANGKKTSGTEIELYQKIGITASTANNPWLQELPDPISKATWDNYLSVSPKYAASQGLETGDLVKVGSVTVPAYVQPGQANGTVALALGYGRTNTGQVAEGVGVNANEFLSINGSIGFNNDNITITKTGGSIDMALTQTHHSMEGRAIIRETTLEDYIVNPNSGNEFHKHYEEHLKAEIYSGHEYPGHHWGMAIDLSTCTGCSACVVSCQAENNVPVVGRNEVVRAHEMSWLRMDRYYSGDLDNPEVSFQPIMCQQCDNAPCENVCPVGATNHSTEGINQMAYNRCIGTRYCNNNCPYKVRRFNWYDYTGGDSIMGNEFDAVGMQMDLPRMVLNPDVTIRAKGVIEKCNFCIQRIQEKKLDAKSDGRPLEDGEIKTACISACPSDSIVFGDMNDPNSKVSKLLKEQRSYHVLEELNTLPSVAYLTKIRNVKPDPNAKKEQHAPAGGHH